MRYRKITREVVVNEEETEVLVQALNDGMDKVGEHITVFWSQIHDAETETSANAAEIATLAN